MRDFIPVPVFYIPWTVKTLLFITGCTKIKHKKLQLTIISIITLAYASVFTLTIITAINLSNFSMITESVCMILIFMSPLGIALITIAHESVLFRTLERIENEKDARIIKTTNKRLIKLLILIIELIILWEIPYLACGLTVAVISDVKLGTMESLYFPMYIPWRYDTIMRYGFAILFECFVVLYPFLVEYAMIFTLGSFYIYIDAKLANLLVSLNEITLREHLTYSNLVRVIDKYQNWKSTSKELLSYIADCSTVTLFCITLTSVLSIANLTESEVPIPLKIKNISALLYLFGHLFMFSLLGEYLKNTDDEIRNAIYDISWHTGSTELRKIVTIFMMQTQTPMTIKAYGMISVNQSLILSILSNIYSVLNLYRKTYRNE
ncbi:uncharacterized protein LOC135844506 [Planococcus citri]|uniref:uncharacterized protein LOC135844506 n=1 Tax=Planococcus citri TaxID=170843 RepID=UPI0031F87A19